MNEYRYSLTQKGHIVECAPEEDPRDPITLGASPAQLLSKSQMDEQNLTEEKLKSKGNAAIWLVPRKDSQPEAKRYVPQGSDEAEPDAEPEYLLFREITMTPNVSTNTMNRAIKHGYTPEQVYAHKQEQWLDQMGLQLKKDWVRHNLYLDNKIHQYTLYNNYGHKLMETFHNITEKEFQAYQKEAADKTRSTYIYQAQGKNQEQITNFPDFQSFQKKYAVRLGLQAPGFQLSKPEKLPNGYLLEVQIRPEHPELMNSLLRKIPEDAPNPDDILWTLRVVPSQLDRKNPRSGIALEWEDIGAEDDASGTIPLGTKELFELRSSFSVYAEKVLSQEAAPAMSGKSFGELATALNDHTVVLDNRMNNRKEWAKARQKQQCRTPEFLEDYLRAGNSLYNSQTGEVIVPIMSKDTGALSKLYSLNIRVRDVPERISDYAMDYEKKTGRRLSNPVGTWVKSKLNGHYGIKNSEFDMDGRYMVETIPANQLSRYIQNHIAYFPINKRVEQTIKWEQNHESEFQTLYSQWKEENLERWQKSHATTEEPTHAEALYELAMNKDSYAVIQQNLDATEVETNLNAEQERNDSIAQKMEGQTFASEEDQQEWIEEQIRNQQAGDIQEDIAMMDSVPMDDHEMMEQRNESVHWGRDTLERLASRAVPKLDKQGNVIGTLTIEGDRDSWICDPTEVAVLENKDERQNSNIQLSLLDSSGKINGRANLLGNDVSAIQEQGKTAVNQRQEKTWEARRNQKAKEGVAFEGATGLADTSHIGKESQDHKPKSKSKDKPQQLSFGQSFG